MKALILLGVAASCAAPTVAMAAAPQGSGKDPNRMVCRTEPVVGSRLAKTQRCMTASEWAEQKRLDRQQVEKSQMRDQKSGG